MDLKTNSKIEFVLFANLCENRCLVFTAFERENFPCSDHRTEYLVDVAVLAEIIIIIIIRWGDLFSLGWPLNGYGLWFWLMWRWQRHVGHYTHIENENGEDPLDSAVPIRSFTQQPLSTAAVELKMMNDAEGEMFGCLCRKFIGSVCRQNKCFQWIRCVS